MARHGWLWAWLGQILVMALVCPAACLAQAAPEWARMLALWGAVPLAGAVTSYRAVLRGLLNYAAWIAPPVLLYIVHIALWGYVPPVSAALACALASLVGAAAGEVKKGIEPSKPKNGGNPWKRT